MQNEEQRRVIESIKLRAPIEEIVRERVPGLKKAGSLWKACCPFHQEKTPSFTVDPRRGLWHCFGACSAGGDQFAFLQRLDNLSFPEALEILAARTGVELPRRQTAERSVESEGFTEALEAALAFYRAQLASAEGAAARRYQRERGLSDATADAFALGYAPASGHALVEHLRERKIELEAAEQVGLVRRNEQGRPYDFFRGRWMIPIKDERGRPVGFGARRMADDDASGPKYINTAETPLFHKARLFYALDRALSSVRKQNHIVLVEGYTDVMAAHQAGVTNVVAVLGTATTEDHAALIRKSGARRVSLVFDGDEAGRKAAYKGLHGLLPLDVTLDVVSLSGGIDPCDLFVREGSAPFLAALELSTSWFDFLVAPLAGLERQELSREVDRVLELIARLSKPVHRHAMLNEFALRLKMPVEALREQGNALARPHSSRSRANPDGVPAVSLAAAAPSIDDARRKQCYSGLVGALLCDPSLVPLARGAAERCPAGELDEVLRAIFALYEDENAELDLASVLAELGESPARNQVVPLADHAALAESPRGFLEDQLRALQALDLAAARRAIIPELALRERENTDTHDAVAIELSRRLSMLHEVETRATQVS